MGFIIAIDSYGLDHPLLSSYNLSEWALMNHAYVF